MLLAILAGTGALAALVAIGVDMGRFYGAREHVARAVRSDAQALGEQCFKRFTGTGPLCTSAQSLYEAAVASANADGGLERVVAVCVDTSTAPARLAGTASDDLTASCWGATGASDPNVGVAKPSTSAICLNKVRPYVRVVLQAAQPVRAFMPVMGDKTYSDCGQATWLNAYLGSTVTPFVAPAWQWDTSGTSVLMSEATSEGGGGGSRTVTSETANWGAAYSPASTVYQYSSPYLLGLDTSTLPGPPTCGSTVKLLLNSVQVTGSLISNTCVGPALGAALAAWVNSLDGWPVALAGDFTDPVNSCIQANDCWNIRIVAFAKFHLSNYKIGNGKWAPTMPANLPDKCLNQALCLFGTWDAASLKFAGNSEYINGIQVLQ